MVSKTTSTKPKHGTKRGWTGFAEASDGEVEALKQQADSRWAVKELPTKTRTKRVKVRSDGNRPIEEPSDSPAPPPEISPTTAMLSTARAGLPPNTAEPTPTTANAGDLELRAANTDAEISAPLPNDGVSGPPTAHSEAEISAQQPENGVPTTSAGLDEEEIRPTAPDINAQRSQAVSSRAGTSPNQPVDHVSDASAGTAEARINGSEADDERSEADPAIVTGDMAGEEIAPFRAVRPASVLLPTVYRELELEGASHVLAYFAYARRMEKRRRKTAPAKRQKGLSCTMKAFLRVKSANEYRKERGILGGEATAAPAGLKNKKNKEARRKVTRGGLWGHRV